MADPRAVPYDYLDQLRRQQQNGGDDPVEATVRAIQTQQVRSDIARSGEPGAVARVTRLAREADVPPVLIEDRVDEVEAMRRARTFTDFLAGSTALTRWAQANPRGAVAASDDTESLGVLGAGWDTLKKIPARALGQGGFQGGAGLRFLTDRVMDWGSVASAALQSIAPPNAAAIERGDDPFDVARREIAGRAADRDLMRRTARDYAERNAGVNWGTEQVLSGFASTLPSLAGAGVGAATRSPAAGLGVAIAPVFGNEYERARSQGLRPDQSLLYAGQQTFIEGATEKLPVGFLAEMIVKRLPFGKALARQLFAENVGEQVATHTQDFVEWATLPENSNKTFGDYLDARPGAALATVLATTGATTAETAAATGLNRAMSVAANVSGRIGQTGQARAERQAVDQLARGAEGSKLRQRDPEAFRDLTRQQAEEAGTSDVFIPGEAVKTYQQSDSYDRQDDPFSRYDVDEAAATGGDIVIPIEDFLTDIVGTTGWNAVRDHVRLTPGGMSSQEAQTFEESMDDVMAGLGEQAAQADRSDQQARTVREKIVDRLAEQFGTSFTAPAARSIAEVAAQRMQTRASRLGQDLSESDLDGFEVRQVMPEGVAEAVKADQLDLVINALRQGKPVESGVGPSLLDFIKQRGGVNDTGGDLAAMGVPAKFLRDFDPAQGELTGGLSGQGDFGLDTTLRAAIEAGFFPDLANVENEAGPSTLDTQRLLDALAEEAAGRPVHAETRTDPMRAAAEDLRTMLEQSGMVPDAMSDAEVRTAVEGMTGEEAQGRAFAQTDGFKRWFGDSKVVDENGNPLVMYHGTTADFEAFDKSRVGARWDVSIGLHFSDRPTEASLYAGTEIGSNDGHVVPVYLKIENPLVVETGAEAWRYADDNRFELIREIVQSRRKADADDPVKRQAEDDALLAALQDGNPFAEAEFAPATHIASKSQPLKPYDGIIIRGSDGMNAIAFEPEQVKSVNNRGTFDPSDRRILFQSDMSDQARGRIVFDSNQRIIELFQSRNLSTPLHELSHMWLEELVADASLPDAPDQLKADWKTVKTYFAANGHKVGKDGMIPTEAHELWARSGERYMMEGKAPTSSLIRLFEQFRAWLVNIYKTVDKLRAPISPEIREVFDRLLATDEEIAAAKERQGLDALFKDAAEAGMTKDEFGAYQRQVDDARAGAHAALIDKTMKAIRRRETERYRDARKGVRAEEQERIDGSPLFKALAGMKENRVSREWIVDNMGGDALGLLPVRVPPLYVDGGSDPNVIAEQSGYAGAQDMLEAVIGAERAHRQAKEGGDTRSMRERAIETATDEEMNRRWGDPLNDGSIEREALAAVQSDMQGEVIASELRVLSRKAGRRPTPYQLAREWARGKVRAGTVAQEASPAAIQRYARNAAKAGREAEKAMLAQDADEAFRQKQFQMLNTALLVSAKEAQDEVTAAVRRMDRTARAKTRESTDQDYLEQAHALLESVDLKKRSQAGIDRQGKWEQWSAAREAEGYEIVVPPSFAATINKTNWSRLSVENLLALDEAVKQVLHLGRLKQTLLDNEEQREWEGVYKEAEAAGDNIGRKPPKGSFTEPGFWDSVKHRVSTADAALLKMETVFDWMDQGNSNGVFNRIAFRPIAEAQARESEMLHDYYGRVKAAMEKVPAKDLKRWGDKLEIDLIDPETGRPAVMTRQKLIAMALNWGNAGNRQRLADGYGWSQVGIEKALTDSLTKAEWQFVQEIWDTIDGLWPQIEKMERDVNGVAPEKIEATEVVTPFGNLKGGYYPAVYDTTLDYKAEEQAGKRSDLFESTYTKATTRSSATKDRMEKVSRPILLDLGVISRHLGEVIHDVTHREPVMKAWKFLNNQRVMKSVDDTLGREAREQFRPWLQHVANSWAQERAGNEGLGKFMQKLRANATMVGMGWRFTTMMTQLAGYSNSIEAVGEKHFSAALAKFTANPIATTRFVLENSDEVRHRVETLDRDIAAELKKLAEPAVGKAARPLTAAKEFAFHGIGYMDRVVSVPTWLAGYNKALAAGMSEKDAKYAGDKAVRQSQGSGGPKDLAAVQRGTGRWGEALKLMTMFYSYMSAFYQRERTLGRDVRRSKPRDLPKLMARAWWLMVVPPMLASVLSGQGPGDDEDGAWWAFRKMLGQALGPIPLARDLFEPAWAKATDNPTFGYRFSPVQGFGESAIRVAGDAGNVFEGEETKHATRDVMELAGYSTGLIPGQMASATQFLVDVGAGGADPEGFAQWYEGLTTGRVKAD